MNTNSDTLHHEKYMRIALKEAHKALLNGDVPVGAVICLNDIIISKAYNRVEKDKDATAHAELLAIKKAIKIIGYKHLLQCTLYSTLEPCTMCAGAIILARFKSVVFAADDPKAGACGSVFNITDDTRLNHKCDVISGILAEEASKLLKEFFRKLRKSSNG